MVKTSSNPEKSFGTDGAELWRQLQALIAGRSANLVLNVLGNAMATVVIQAAATTAEAEEMIDEACENLKRSIDLNWETVRKHTGQMASSDVQVRSRDLGRCKQHRGGAEANRCCDVSAQHDHNADKGDQGAR